MVRWPDGEVVSGETELWKTEGGRTASCWAMKKLKLVPPSLNLATKSHTKLTSIPYKCATLLVSLSEVQTDMLFPTAVTGSNDPIIDLSSVVLAIPRKPISTLHILLSNDTSSLLIQYLGIASAVGSSSAIDSETVVSSEDECDHR